MTLPLQLQDATLARESGFCKRKGRMADLAPCRPLTMLRRSRAWVLKPHRTGLEKSFSASLHLFIKTRKHTTSPPLSLFFSPPQYPFTYTHIIPYQPQTRRPYVNELLLVGPWGGGQDMGLPRSSPQKLQFPELQHWPSPDTLCYIYLNTCWPGRWLVRVACVGVLASSLSHPLTSPGLLSCQ